MPPACRYLEVTLRKGTGPPTKIRWARTWGSRSITHRCPTLPTGKASSCLEHSPPELCIQPLAPLAMPWPQKAMVWPPKDLASSPGRGGDCFLPTEAAVHCGIKQASLLSIVISSAFLKSFQVPSPESPYSDRLKGSGPYREDGLLVPCCVSPAPLSHMTWQDGDLLREASPARSAGAQTLQISASAVQELCKVPSTRVQDPTTSRDFLTGLCSGRVCYMLHLQTNKQTKTPKRS